MSEKTAKKSSPSYLFWLILIVAALICILIFFLTYSNTTTTKTTVSKNEESYVICTRDTQDESNVISTKNPVSVKEELRATFTNDQLVNATRTYSGEYSSNDDATKAESEIHAAYNIYIGANNNIFSEPSYNIVNSTMKMILYTDSSNYKNSMTKTLFFFDPKEDSSDPVSPSSFMSDLRSENFTCNQTINSQKEDN